MIAALADKDRSREKGTRKRRGNVCVRERECEGNDTSFHSQPRLLLPLPPRPSRGTYYTVSSPSHQMTRTTTNDNNDRVRIIARSIDVCSKPILTSHGFGKRAYVLCDRGGIRKVLFYTTYHLCVQRERVSERERDRVRDRDRRREGAKNTQGAISRSLAFCP